MADDLRDVRVSIMKNFEDQFDAGNDIDWEGQDFDTDASTAWMQPRLLGPVSEASRDGDRTENWILNVNVFAKLGEDSAGNFLEGINKHWELADLVRDQYSQKSIAVQDWSEVGDPTIGFLRFAEADVTPVSAPGESAGLEQLNVSVAGTIIL